MMMIMMIVKEIKSLSFIVNFPCVVCDSVGTIATEVNTQLQ
jgi:hypothetical protein